MSFVVRKLPLAEQDALDAAIWYEQRQPGLGEEFLGEVDRAVRMLCESALPLRNPIRGRASRADTSIQILRDLLHRSRRRGLDIGDLSRSPPPASATGTCRANWLISGAKVRLGGTPMKPGPRGDRSPEGTLPEIAADPFAATAKAGFGWQPKRTG